MADVRFLLLVLLSSPWNLVLSWGQDICSGPFHLQPCRFFLCLLELSPPSVLNSLDVSGFLRKKLSYPWDTHCIPVEWNRDQRFLSFKSELDTPTCCRQTWTSLAFTLLWLGLPITLLEYLSCPPFFLLNPAHCWRTRLCPTFSTNLTALDPPVIPFSEALLHFIVNAFQFGSQVLHICFTYVDLGSQSHVISSSQRQKPSVQITGTSPSLLYISTPLEASVNAWCLVLTAAVYCDGLYISENH